MSDAQGKRYRSPRRAAAAAETRRRLVACASELFLQRGFARTTTKAVATAAAVTERTLFLNFPSKAALLAACIRAAIREGADTVPMLEQPEWQQALAADPAQVYRLLAEATTGLFERAAGLLAIGEAAASDDPLLDEQRRQGHDASRADLLQVAKAMKAAGAIRHGISAQHAADAMFALAANETLYLRVVDELGWTPTRYAHMLEQALRGALGQTPS